LRVVASGPMAICLPSNSYGPLYWVQPADPTTVPSASNSAVILLPAIRLTTACCLLLTAIACQRVPTSSCGDHCRTITMPPLAFVSVSVLPWTS
jgi:hypothetical protein